MNAPAIIANAGAVLRLTLRRRAAGGAAVLGYHDVAGGAAFDEHYTVSADQLRMHIRLLRRLGLAIVPLAEIVRRQRAGETTDGLAALTFDDALVGVYEHGLAVLADEAAPATIFVVTDALGIAPRWWPGSTRTMTVDELRDALGAGIMLDAHSSVHASLPSLDLDALTDDLRRCRAALQSTFGVDSSILAYPYGHQAPAVRAAAAAAGFSAAVTFLNGRIGANDDPFRLPRLTAHRDLDRFTLARHLARNPERWPDHQSDVVLAGGPSAPPSGGVSASPSTRPPAGPPAGGTLRSPT